MAINDQFKKLTRKEKRMFVVATMMELELTALSTVTKISKDGFKKYELEIAQGIMDKIKNGTKVELAYVVED